MQGTWVRSLVQEDPTCHRATKPVHHNYWACALEPASHNYWSPRDTTTEACVPRARAPRQNKPPQWEARAPQRRVTPTRRNQRKPVCSNEDPTQPKINTYIHKKKNYLEVPEIKVIWYWHKERNTDHWSRIKSPEESYTYLIKKKKYQGNSMQKK